MILLSPVADPPDLADTACSVCQTCVSIPCVDKIDTREDLECLLAGTLNMAPCPTCGTAVTAEQPVYLDLPEPGIRYLGYAPLDLLEDDLVCASMIAEGNYQHIFYSLDELARQVQARLRLSQFAPGGLKSDGSLPMLPPHQNQLTKSV